MNNGADRVEKTADRIRAELLTTLHELDRRRHLALNLRYQISKRRPLLIAVSASVMLAIGLGVTIGVVRSRARKNHLLQERILGVLRAWEHPQRIANSSVDRPPWPRHLPLSSQNGARLACCLQSGRPSSLHKPYRDKGEDRRLRPKNCGVI
jgi:hypothetical protein